MSDTQSQFHGSQAADDDSDGPQDVLPRADPATEAELRQMYDDEELDRFLHLFSNYVTEFRMPAASANVDHDGAEYRLNQPRGPTPPPLPRRPSDKTRSISEKIAYRYLLPYIPPASLPAPPFTIKRLRLTSQRLYLAVVPPYKQFFVHIAHLALWKDQQQSSLYCAVFWILWYHDLLLPALLFRIFLSLICRRLYTYPTLAELQKRRLDVAQAKEFGEEVQERLSASSLGVQELWRLFKVYKTSTKNKAKSLAKSKAVEKGVVSPTASAVDITQGAGQEETTVLDEVGVSKEEQDIKRDLLHILNELADLHERVKNIFIWRRPASSRIYAAAGCFLVLFALMCLFVSQAMAFLTILVLILPAHYLAKLVYFVGGALFWHVTPVIAALSPSDRARLPPAFADAPTDADYAMELISQRVANGLDVLPSAAQHSRDRSQSNPQSVANLSTTSFSVTQEDPPSSTAGGSSGVDWKKWGGRVALGKSWIEDGKRVLTTGQLPDPRMRSSRGPYLSPSSSGSSLPLESVETHTFPAHHATAPGLITLTPTTFYFTSLVSSQAKLTIPYNQLCGVKKTGLMKGLSLTWIPTDEPGGKEKEEKFHWVGSRDELFARLIGPDGRRWKRV
ncbi:hypothetical protein BV22DRAFT_999354 [Leucogyrophana mollusca]|uniref:Uncharacterized protein n=1 Tax=Leucogyrophana mollusca TaxID=85980 RepID=A0ACB8C0B4_9AGAM|nr:hypothetical protein BV22DRAFT_999354 [Leucogyrophana mollusca]